MANSYQYDPKWQKRHKTRDQKLRAVALPGAFVGYEKLLGLMKDSKTKEVAKDQNDKPICPKVDDISV